MGVVTEQITLNDTTPTQLITDTSVVGTASDPIPVVVENIDESITIYLGNSEVASDVGLPLVAGASISFSFVGTDGQDLYAISESGEPVVALLWTRGQGT